MTATYHPTLPCGDITETVHPVFMLKDESVIRQITWQSICRNERGKSQLQVLWYIEEVESVSMDLMKRNIS